MSLREIKNCPRCSKPFECKPGNITECQCFYVHLTPEDIAYIKEQYDDCLCRDCLLELKEQNKKKSPKNLIKQ